jgi:hypothetical protein
MMPGSVALLKPNEKNRKPIQIGRCTEFSIQLHQAIDATLLVLSLWIGYAIRYGLGQIFEWMQPVESLSAFVWFVILLIPFGPRLLEMQGFYEYPLQKTVIKSFRQVVLALLCLGILICGCLSLHHSAAPV